MQFQRRAVLLGGGALLGTAAVAAPGPARAQAPAAPPAAPSAATEARMAERAAGRAGAPVTIIEYFSLTCGHCAAFHRDAYPRVKAELLDTGKARMVWRDFPLDQLALAGAMVARALPPAQYEAFVGTLLATQDRWAFAREADHVGEIAKMAAVAGLNRAQVDAVLQDQDLARAIMEGRARAQSEHRVNSTPTFVFNSRVVPGALTFERVAELVREATPG